MRAAKAQHRPTIQNKPLPKRRLAVKAVRTAATRLTLAKPPRRRAAQKSQPRRQPTLAVKPNGMNVFGLLALASALLALVFVTALHWQRQALQLGQQEVELRSQIDLSVNEQRQLQVERNKARSPRETRDRSKSAGLDQFKLDVDTSKPAAKSAKPRSSASGILQSVTPPMGR
jgi:cell division protein FtsL